jgi:capsular polysaccharide biosynthesis protein
LFDQADIIVGPSGSAFANMIFADEGTLVQIVPYGTDVPPWYIFTSEMGLSYDYYFSDTCENIHYSLNKNSDMYLCPDSLVEKLDKIIENKDK